ncbi:MAG: hypothetical protein A3D65_05125 [Candidatus Lloydbacteria bacterium RIFCSPHIGHO2_02_FULL_50_13]|uniref:Uncharacterized protein n=1 Tax=Candidatus Lloydbacteria bacterium RIFCSPHIGHO2_02_FULL_50_13 TaxID=1798661 RepID=A0A1G2D6T5_9BACT|nr:MAG: hypothetical protein A3D65_05125 [Candidatus Lloydbacteria bacterium RIFCSPHIGHO2_02_FULL_50_13]
MADENQKIKIVVPWWPGPTGDEWDSPGYNEFWGPVERTVNQRILDAEKEGKTVELVAPNDFVEKTPEKVNTEARLMLKEGAEERPKTLLQRIKSFFTNLWQ